jgi:hypothetical protein
MRGSIDVFRGMEIEVTLNMELKLYCRFLAIIMCLGLSSIAQADVSAQLSVEGLSFISPDYGTTQDKSFSFIGASIRTPKRSSQQVSIFNIDLEAKYAIGKPVLSYTNAREIYFFQESENVNISYGRRLHQWSQLEEAWDLGFFQPQFRWNSIDPSAQGLVGIFLDNQEVNTLMSTPQNLRWTLFGSPLFVPDQGPGYELKQGQFEASNPWFSPPPQNVEFDGQIVPIDYNVQVPQTNEVLFQSIYGAQIVYQFDSGAYVQTSFISKPSHQIALTYKAVLVADRVKADIIPKIYREQNIALDMGYRQDWGSLGVMVLSNNPDQIVPDVNYNYPEIKSSVSWGPQVKLNLGQFRLFGSGLMVSGGEVIDRGPDAGQVTKSLTSKFMYKTAYQLGALYKGRLNRTMTLQSEVNWTEGSKSAIKILKIKNKVNLYRSFGLYVDVLLVETDDKETSSTSSNVSHLQNLDQVLLGASYEF